MNPSLRLKVMFGGRFLILCGLFGFTVQLFWLLGSLHPLLNLGFASWVIVTNAIWSLGAVLLLLRNGVLRIFFTSKRLSIARRILMLCTLWIPLVNLVVPLYACRLVYEEYDFACNKQQLQSMRAHSMICKTESPILLVHGIFFRDLRYFNYWGRIPRELISNGACVYYANQEAEGTVPQNGQDIKRCIQQVMAQTGCEKVNIIAHSKGGLDARYAITTLGMADHVASLTTMNTPHQGCKFVDYACHMPDDLYHRTAGFFDRAFRRRGMSTPTSTMQPGSLAPPPVPSSTGTSQMLPKCIIRASPW